MIRGGGGGMKNEAKNKIKDRPAQSLSSSPLFPPWEDKKSVVNVVLLNTLVSNTRL